MRKFSNIGFKGYAIPMDFKSDGCTFARDSWFGVKITDACVLHDYMRRYNVEKKLKADWIFAQHIYTLFKDGLKRPEFTIPVVIIYFIGVQFESLFYKIKKLLTKIKTR